MDIAQYVYPFLNFSIFCVILYFVARNPVKNFLETRERVTNERVDKIFAEKKTLEKLVADLLSKIEAYGEESKEIRLLAIQQAHLEAAKIMKDAQFKANALVESAVRYNEAHFEAAKKSFERELFENLKVHLKKGALSGEVLGEFNERAITRLGVMKFG